MQTMTKERRRDHWAGALVALIGAAAAWIGHFYGVGSLTHMGSGFFPVALGLAMIGIGVLIAATGGDATPDPIHGPDRKPDPRGWLCIIAAVLLFLGLAQYAGLLPATFACVFTAAIGDRQARLLPSLALAVCISLFGALVFSTALQVPIPLLGPMP